MRTRRRLLAGLLFAAMVAACGGGAGTGSAGPGSGGPVDEADLEVITASVTQRAEPVIADAGDVEDVGGATAAFALDLYRNVVGEQDGNVIVGPYSAWLALAMTSVGAAGTTNEELASALRFPFEEPRLLPAANALDRILTHQNDDGDVTFNVANRLWGQRGSEFRAPFLDALTEHFGAPMVVADFDAAPDASRDEINGWVAGRTEERIPELLPAEVIDTSTELVLVNAVHLDAPWEFPFEPAQTAPGPFTRVDGSTVRTEMMRYDQYLPTGLDERWVAVELPYEGGGLSMVVVVPRDFATFEASLDDAILGEVLDGITEGGVHLTMPKFSFSTHASLEGPLRAMGVQAAFEPNADFSRMTEGGGLSIGAVEHEAFIEVDEAGTEAAAATGVDMLGSHGPTIDVNRPFIFLIRDRATNAVLFMGRVLDPSA